MTSIEKALTEINGFQKDFRETIKSMGNLKPKMVFLKMPFALNRQFFLESNIRKKNRTLSYPHSYG